MWGNGGAVFAVGANGTILRYNDGIGWSAMTSNTTKDLKGVWGSDASDIFVVGEGAGPQKSDDHSTILHYDGSGWSPMTSETTVTLTGVWGSSGSNVFAVGEHGTILHYSDSGWSAMTSGTIHALYGVWGSGSEVVTVGDSGTILRRDMTTTTSDFPWELFLPKKRN
ncbi:MAG: hypothetical protein CSA34_00145 [Desulfobulbus propionicus]|nr:MAG: hypothetical protein CSA34_00145 [Desulfobulbus propionicus]